MGLIKAISGSIGGVMADQWKEYFYCEAIPADVLVTKGHKKVSGRSSNTVDDNVITNGSVIAVADGQCMVIVDQGKVVDLCAEPGEYTYDMSTEPSVFDGGKLGKNLLAVFQNIGKRFTFGGEIPKDQRVYYFNVKEIPGNKYGTPAPVPFRMVDRRENMNIDLDINIRCFGEYSYKITNPILFYTNVSGNVKQNYMRSEIDSQMKSELLTKLQKAFGTISQKQIRYSELPLYTVEIADELNELMSAEWRDKRGVEIFSFGISSVTATEEDEKRIKEMQQAAAFTNATAAGAWIASNTGAAMQTAAANEGGMGAMGAFMGLNMGQTMGGNMASNLFAMGQQQAAAQAPAPAAPQAPAGDTWTCSCGSVNTGKFCSNCGSPKPEAPAKKFCTNCGSQVEAGAKFCPNCGNKLA